MRSRGAARAKTLCKDVQVELWSWLWAWGRDPEVWNWLRPALSALAGAAVGGWFTLGGQRKAAALQAARDEKAWERERAVERRQLARDDARALLEDFTDLRRQVDHLSTGIRFVDRGVAVKAWGDIWTRPRSLKAAVRAGLLPDAEVRAEVQGLVALLDYADEISVENRVPSPGTAHSLRSLVSALAAEGTEVMAAYLREEKHETTRADLLDEIRRASVAWDAWVEREVENAEALAAEWAESIRREGDLD
jgi:hypothetical protein